MFFIYGEINIEKLQMMEVISVGYIDNKFNFYFKGSGLIKQVLAIAIIALGILSIIEAQKGAQLVEKPHTSKGTY